VCVCVCWASLLLFTAGESFASLLFLHTTERDTRRCVCVCVCVCVRWNCRHEEDEGCGLLVSLLQKHARAPTLLLESYGGSGADLTSARYKGA